MLDARGYGEVKFVSIAPRRVIASAHKIVRGQDCRVEALGLDAYDAERKLVKVVMRP